MKKIIKQIGIFALSIMIILSTVNVPIYASAAVAAGVGPILRSIGYTALGTGVASVVSHIMDSWLGTGKEYYNAAGENIGMNYYANGSNFGEMTNSGADNEFCYNTFSSTVTDKRSYSLVQNVDNSVSLYCPITQNYVTTNNISYNQQYDTYYIQNNEYNYYVTNNYTYVSYYIINNETNEEDYYEVYYELPDGRNSYDLRYYEVWGEYFVYDVVGYDSIKEDDGKTLALYHFNGNTKDDSYWKVHDFPQFNGIYQDAKFGQGLYFKSSLSYYETAYTYTLPEQFDNSNYTIEFTILSKESSISGYNGASDSTDYITFYTSDSHNDGYCFKHMLWEGGIHNYVIQVNNGVPTVYINGSKIDEVRDFNVVYDDPLIKIGYKDVISFHSYILNENMRDFYVLDELRISSCALYSGDSISVPSQEFDTNQVLVTPKFFHEGMIAVQGAHEVSNYRIGGVRPTYPTDGFVYIYLEEDVVKDIQQYQGDGWYSINGALRKNGKWVDLKEYDLSKLSFEEDKDDNTDENPDGSVSGNDSDGSVSGNDTGSDSGGGLGGFLEGLGSLGESILKILGKVLEYIGKAIELFTSTVLKIVDIIPKSITSLVSALFPFIPKEWFIAIELSLVLSVILGIVRIFKK